MSDRGLVDAAFTVLVEHFKHGKEECATSDECECDEGAVINAGGAALCRIDSENSSLREQVRTLTADNAVMRDAMGEISTRCETKELRSYAPDDANLTGKFRRVLDGVWELARGMHGNIHPGAALLAEMDGLRRQVETLTAERDVAQVEAKRLTMKSNAAEAGEALAQSILADTRKGLETMRARMLSAETRAGTYAAAAGDADALRARVAGLEDAATKAAAELRHAYRAETRDWNLVARAIRLLEEATTTKHTPEGT